MDLSLERAHQGSLGQFQAKIGPRNIRRPIYLNIQREGSTDPFPWDQDTLMAARYIGVGSGLLPTVQGEHKDEN